MFEGIGQALRCPHARGGGPKPETKKATSLSVVPMLVGVGRANTSHFTESESCPHARGGGPVFALGLAEAQLVVPMLVGMGRERAKLVRANPCCPHARGGGPLTESHRVPV